MVWEVAVVAMEVEDLMTMEGEMERPVYVANQPNRMYSVTFYSFMGIFIMNENSEIKMCTFLATSKDIRSGLFHFNRQEWGRG